MGVGNDKMASICFLCVRTYGGACKHVSRPMQTETRWRKDCSQIVNLNKQLKIFAYRRCGENGEYFHFFNLSRACTRCTFCFHVDTCRHPDKKLAHATIDLRSWHRINPRPTRLVSGKANEYRWRSRSYQVGPWYRGQEVARGVLHSSPRPEKGSIFCHRRGIDLVFVLCFLHISA